VPVGLLAVRGPNRRFIHLAWIDIAPKFCLSAIRVSSSFNTIWELGLKTRGGVIDRGARLCAFL
jgi:hypothetical protein